MLRAQSTGTGSAGMPAWPDPGSRAEYLSRINARVWLTNPHWSARSDEIDATSPRAEVGCCRLRQIMTGPSRKHPTWARGEVKWHRGCERTQIVTLKGTSGRCLNSG